MKQSGIGGRWAVWLWVAIVLCCGHAMAATSPKRVALVVGNASYSQKPLKSMSRIKITDKLIGAPR